MAQPLETRVATRRGRPTLYRPDLCERARRHLGQGATLAQLAGLLDVSSRSIDNWVSRIPAFAAAVQAGRAEAEAALDRLLYQRAVGYSRTVERVVRCRGRVEIVRYTKHHAPDARACMRFLCRRAPQDWRRRPDLPPKRAADDRGVNRAHKFPADAAPAALAPAREEESGRPPEHGRVKDGAVEGPALAREVAPRRAGFSPGDVEPRWGGFQGRLPLRAAWHRRAAAQGGVTAGEGEPGRTVDVPFATRCGPRTRLRRRSTAWDEFATVVSSTSPRPPCGPVATSGSKAPIGRTGIARFEAR